MKKLDDKLDRKRIVPVIVFAIFGVATDFLCNGVFKMDAFLIYGSVYLVVALTLNSHLSKNPKWAPFSLVAVAAFVVGAFGGRFIFAGYESQRIYPMRVIKNSPITLKPEEGSQVLIVESEKLDQKLVTLSDSDRKNIPVLIDVVTEYGCIKVFEVREVAGIDVKNDREASWSWKAEAALNSASARTSDQLGLGVENRWRPWCIQKSYALEPL